MFRDNKGRFAKRTNVKNFDSDSELINRMMLNLSKKPSREVPIIDNRSKKQITNTVSNDKEQDLINKAIGSFFKDDDSKSIINREKTFEKKSVFNEGDNPSKMLVSLYGGFILSIQLQPIVEHISDFNISYSDNIFCVNINIDTRKFPDFLTTVKTLKKFETFMVDIIGYDDKDRFLNNSELYCKFSDLNYDGEKNIYTIKLLKVDEL